MAEDTKTLWDCKDHGYIHAGDETIAAVYLGPKQEFYARLICKCVNLHDELVAGMKAVLHEIERCGYKCGNGATTARALLEKVKETEV